MQVFTVLFTAIYKVMHELRTHFNRMCIILVGGHLAESTHFDLLRTYVAVCERTYENIPSYSFYIVRQQGKFTVLLRRAA